MKPRVSYRYFSMPWSLSRLILGSLLFSSAILSAAEKRVIAYVGTFSSPLKNMRSTQVDLPPGNGKGIHFFEMDQSSGKLKPLGIHEMGNSPSCLVANATGTHLYSANETDRLDEAETGSVSAFKINAADGSLTAINTVKSGGKGPTYVSLHPSGKHLFVANYFGGSVAVLPIKPDGSLGEATDVKKDIGHVGPTKATHAPTGSFAHSGHDQTHAHMIAPDPSGKFVLHVDLGQDLIYVWKFDAESGVLSPNEPPTVALPPGDGPRHFAFHPNGRWLYSIQEEGSTVVLFDYAAERGLLTARQTISSLPPGYAGSNFCSEIMLSLDGKTLYAGNRLHDSIGLFAVGSDGTLTHKGDEWTRGNYPRSFNLDPSGRYLYCCNQRADNLTTFRLNQEGNLNFTGQFTAVGNPSIIIFVELPSS